MRSFIKINKCKELYKKSKNMNILYNHIFIATFADYNLYKGLKQKSLANTAFLSIIRSLLTFY